MWNEKRRMINEYWKINPHNDCNLFSGLGCLLLYYSSICPESISPTIVTTEIDNTFLWVVLESLKIDFRFIVEVRTIQTISNLAKRRSRMNTEIVWDVNDKKSNYIVSEQLELKDPMLLK